MESCLQLVHDRAEDLAAAAADRLDCEECVPGLAALARDMAAAAAEGRALDTEPLLEQASDPGRVARLVRAVEAEAIEILRREFPSRAARQAVLALRAAVRKGLPRPRLDLEDAGRYEELLKPADDSGASFPLRLVKEIGATVRDMILVHDVSGNIFYVNEYGLELTGFDSDDVRAGMMLYDLVVPDYLDVIEARMQSPGASLTAPFTIEFHAKDGERIPVEVFSRPMGHGADFRHFISVARDMRLERRLEQEIQRSRDFLAGIIANAPVGIVTLDTEGIITSANPEAASLAGAPAPEALVGLPIHAIRTQRDEQMRRSILSVLDTGKELRQRLALATRFGREMNCDVVVVPLREKGGAVGGLLLLASDVSEQIALQQTLVESEKLSALGELVAGVAHELNNPLTGIAGYAQLLLKGELPSRDRPRLEHIAQEADRCRRIVQNLLNFARRHDSDKTWHSINEVIEETVALREYQLRTDGIEVTCDLAPGLPALYLDIYQIQRVLLNLINNAQQALSAVKDRQRRLAVASSREGDEVHITVRDNGPGIDGDRLGRVFDPFFTTKSIGEGTGLGLSMAYGIVQDHGGRIRVSSNPGEGALFTVSLPIAPPGKVPAAP